MDVACAGGVTFGCLFTSGLVEVTAQLTAQSKSGAILEQVVGRLSLEPTVSAASWSVAPVLE
ncbi:MAG: hypothetical protein ACREEK_01570 [Bradyrhizobium sp.]